MKGTGRRPPFFLVLALTIIWSGGALGKSIPLDDSGSQALEPSVTMHWKSAVPRPGAGNLMVGTTTIRVHLNLLPWLHRSARIYLALPAQHPGPLTLAWTTQGRFIQGQVRSGERVLVYAGPITAPFMEDVFKFQFAVDGSLLPRATPVTYHFEMDED
jgi:hypothetical protein